MFSLPCLFTGSIAERINWSSFIILIVSWEILVYYPLAHWIVRKIGLETPFSLFPYFNTPISLFRIIAPQQNGLKKTLIHFFTCFRPYSLYDLTFTDSLFV